ADDRKKAYWQLHEFFRPVGGVCIEKQAIAGLHRVELIGVPVHDLALQHVDELMPTVLKQRENLGFLGKGDEVGLDHDAARQAAGVAEELVLVAGAGAATLDEQPLAGGDENGVAALLKTAEQRCDRHAERL